MSRGITPTPVEAASPLSKSFGKGILKLGKQQQAMQRASKVTKVVGPDQVGLATLEEAYKTARVRLQMSQGSILAKFNDDNSRIFNQFKADLQESYEKIKQSTSCPNWLSKKATFN